MAYCTYTDVQLIIETDVSDADITSTITQADKLIDQLGLDGRTDVKGLSMYATAAMIAMKRPYPDTNIGDARPRGPAEYWKAFWDMANNKGGARTFLRT